MICNFAILQFLRMRSQKKLMHKKVLSLYFVFIILVEQTFVWYLTLVFLLSVFGLYWIAFACSWCFSGWKEFSYLVSCFQKLLQNWNFKGQTFLLGCTWTCFSVKKVWQNKTFFYIWNLHPLNSLTSWAQKSKIYNRQ